MKVRFDPAIHAYFEVISDTAEHQIPSVTQIMKEEGICGGFYKGTAKRDRGTLIHSATELYDAFEIMPEADDECLPFVKAWATLRDTLKFEIVESEMMVFHDTLRYAGTLDRIVRMQDGELAVLDIKSGAKAKWHPLQLAAYALAWEAQTAISINSGIAAYLKETGKASVEKYAEYDMRKYKEQWTNIMIRRNEL
jgi:CRISPR/Cas system-associated exonuclease Cas4 (RecB family)